MKIVRWIFLFVICCLPNFAQENGYLGSQSVYVNVDNSYTKAPNGYYPFYINHLGRHGARYLTSSKSSDKVIKELEKAKSENKLTSLGENLLKDVKKLKKYEEGQYGLLSEIGKNMEFEIGKRMYENYPQVFAENRNIFAMATCVKRTQESMEYFLISFKRNNIKESINGEIDPILRFFDLNIKYLKFKKYGDWKELVEGYENRSEIYTQVSSKLFSDSNFLSGKDSLKFAKDLYELYKNQYDIGKDVGLGKYFTNEELAYLWENKNLSMYLEKGPSSVGENLPTDISFALLQDFLTTSENAIKNSDIAANFRFAHAETIIPFASILKIDFASQQTNDLNEVKNIWKDYEVTPMGANIQWIFYKNDKNDILVKMLYNEKEVYFPIESNIKPYYKWSDVKNYYEKVIENLKIKKYNSIIDEVKYFQ